MKIDLTKLNRADLLKLKSDVEKHIKAASQKELKAAREAIEKAAKDHGFTLNEVIGTPKASGKRGKLPPKYRNPADTSQTWSGRGRKPGWIREAEAAGRPLTDFEI